MNAFKKEDFLSSLYEFCYFVQKLEGQRNEKLYERSVCNIINNPATDSMPGSMYAISIYITISVYIYMCVHAFVCLSIFREVTYVDSEGIGWSINFSDTGGGGYGCINGCVISSPSETKVHRSQNIFRRTHRMAIGQVDRVRVINRKKKRFP